VLLCWLQQFFPSKMVHYALYFFDFVLSQNWCMAAEFCVWLCTLSLCKVLISHVDLMSGLPELVSLWSFWRILICWKYQLSVEYIHVWFSGQSCTCNVVLSIIIVSSKWWIRFWSGTWFFLVHFVYTPSVLKYKSL